MKINYGHFRSPENAILMENGLLMAIRLEELSKDNWQQAAELEVTEEQESFVTPNVWTIAETRFYPHARNFVVIDGATMVGFLTYGRDPDDGTWWLYRLMIDRRFQGSGRGKQALRTLIDQLVATEPSCRELHVGYQPENEAAERLYLGAGFVPAGMADWGEKLAVLTLPPAAS